MELDPLLENIFARVDSAKQLAKFSLVCRRWQEVRWTVPGLSFEFEVVDSNDLARKEDIIERVLRCTKNEARGCLKSLKVTIQPIPCKCLWLAYAAESVTRLKLDLFHESSLWSQLSVFHDLQSLKITRDEANVNSFLPMTNESPFTSLRSCSICGTADLLREILAACPVLQKLRFTEFAGDSSRRERSVEVVSASLEYFEFRNIMHPEVSLNLPRLSVLKVAFGYEGWPKGCLGSMENLEKLDVSGECNLSGQTQFGKLKNLALYSQWTSDRLLALLKLTPRVSKFDMREFNLDETSSPMPFQHILGALPSLKTVHLDGFSLESFSCPTGTFICEELIVHVWFYELSPNPNLDLLNDLLRINRARKLVVHYNIEEMSGMGKNWQFLLNLQLLLPGRVEFKYEEMMTADA